MQKLSHLQPTKSEFSQLILDYEHLFTDVPCRTDLVYHDINMKSAFSEAVVTYLGHVIGHCENNGIWIRNKKYKQISAQCLKNVLFRLTYCDMGYKYH